MVREQPVQTKGQRFLEKIENLRTQIISLNETAFSEEDITGYIATLGIAVERFLGDAPVTIWRCTLICLGQSDVKLENNHRSRR